MEGRRRYLFYGLLAAFLLFLVAVFWQVLMAYVVVPLATVIWLLLRIFVLSIGQQVYWWALIFLVALIALFRLLWGPETIRSGEVSQANATLERVNHWRSSIRLNLHETGEANAVKRDLAWLLASMYATNQQSGASFQIRDALLKQEITLPEPVYAFLFESEPSAAPQSFFKHPVAASRQLLRWARRAPPRWVRRWTGRTAAEYYQAIDEVLKLMEYSLEIEHDDRPGSIGDEHPGDGGSV